jgi:glycosyltransferase involved in cell wall biosynthesis
MAPARIVSIQTSRERGGAEYANVDLLDALMRRGHDVVLLTNVPELAAGTNVPVRRIELGPKLSRSTTLRVVLEAPLSLLRLARALRAEAPVHASLLHFKKEQLLCALLPKRLTGRIVWAEWGPVPTALRRGIPRHLYARAARRASCIIAVSEGTRRSLIACGIRPADVRVVPNIIDVDAVSFDPAARVALRGRWDAGEQTLVIGCISRFQRRKRNDVVIDAMEHLAGDALLVMAGEGDEEQTLRDLAARHGKRVRFVPNVRGSIEAFLSACDVLVFAPSPTEGAPRVISMAQLVGVPVVATDREGAAELLGHGTGMIVSPPHDARALAAAIETYRGDAERRRREGEAGRRLARARHDPERTLDTIEDALDLGDRGTEFEHDPGR